MLTTKHTGPVAFYEGSTYAPNQIGTWVASDKRDFPWNTIGTALAGSSGTGQTVDHLMTAAEVLTATGMDLTFQKFPVLDAETGEAIPRLFCTGYDDPTLGRQYIAGVSDRYTVIQPAAALGTFDAVLEAVDGAYYSAGWNMREKAMMGVTITLPNEIVVDPGGADDRIALHLLGVNSFDGSAGLTGQLQATRWWCMNQMAPAMRNAKRSFCLRHTANWQSRVGNIRSALGITTAYAEALDTAANKLHQAPMTTPQFERFIRRLAPFHIDTDASETVRARVMERRADAMTAWVAPHNANISGTRWGALNVVGEFAEWGRKVNGSSRTGTDPIRQRAIGTLVSPHVTGLVTRAFEMLAAA